MRVNVVVEITRDAAGRLPVPLVLAAYRASRAGVVALALNAVSRREVDQVLDAVVHGAASGAVHGVVYMDGIGSEGTLSASRSAAVVLAASDAFRLQLDARGIAAAPAAAGTAILDSIASGSTADQLPHARIPAPVRIPSHAGKLGIGQSESALERPRVA